MNKVNSKRKVRMRGNLVASNAKVEILVGIIKV